MISPFFCVRVNRQPHKKNSDKNCFHSLRISVTTLQPRSNWTDFRYNCDVLKLIKKKKKTIIKEVLLRMLLCVQWSEMSISSTRSILLLAPNYFFYIVLCWGEKTFSCLNFTIFRKTQQKALTSDVVFTLKAFLCQTIMQAARLISEWFSSKWIIGHCKQVKLEVLCCVFAVALLLGNEAYLLKSPASG